MKCLRRTKSTFHSSIETSIGMCYDNDDCADDSTCPKDTPVLYCCMLKND